MRERGVLTCAGTLLGTVALVALFASTEHGRIVFTLGGSARLPQRAKPSSVVAKEFDMGCRLSNWVGLGKCKKGMAEPGCAEAYNSWFASGCLCDYSAYPWGFLPKDITPVGFMWALMKTNTPQTYMGITADAPCMEKPSDCKPPKDGDVRLDIYGHGSLYMYYEHAWRHVVGQLSNATALAQCRRLGFTEGGVREEDASLPVTLGAEPVVLVDEPCLPGEPLLHCARRSRPAADVGAQLRATRLSCRSVGPGACFVNREGHPRCMQGTVRYDKETAPLHMPSMACGTAGTKFLDRPPVVPPSPQTKEQTGCLTLFDDALGRCVTPPAVGGSGGHGRGHSAGHGGGQGSGDRRMCSQACHDSVIQAIRRDDCFEVEVNSSWGVNYGDALKDHAETVYSHCGTDLWQSAALSADTYEKCVDLLLDMFRRCQEDSERHLCSDSCAEKVDEAMAAESCYSVHYYRNEPRAFRGHVTLLNELRERVCIWLPPDWDLTPGTTAAYFYRR